MSRRRLAKPSREQIGLSKEPIRSATFCLSKRSYDTIPTSRTFLFETGICLGSRIFWPTAFSSGCPPCQTTRALSISIPKVGTLNHGEQLWQIIVAISFVIDTPALSASRMRKIQRIQKSRRLIILWIRTCFLWIYSPCLSMPFHSSSRLDPESCFPC